MKKALYLSVAAVSLFAMIFAGCDGSQDIFQEKDYAAISAPQNLKATAQPGLNVITWDVVKDAKSGYEVTRKDAVTGEVKTLAATTPYLADKVGFANQLVDGRKYTYTVVAKSGSELRNGSASVDVTAAIPARGDATVVAAPTDIAFKPFANEGKDQLEVTWTGDANLSYSAYYVYSDGTVPLVYERWVTEGTSLKRQTIPFVGGDTSVKIVAKWDGAEYYKSAEASQTFSGTGSILPNVSNFSVTPDSNGIYTLLWNAVDSATGYDIWRAEFISGSLTENWNDNEEGGYIPSWGGATLGDWQSIDATSAKKNGISFTLTESGVDTSKRYIYGIIAKNSEAKSPLATDTTNAITQSIATTFSSTNIVETKDADGKPQLTIGVDVADGETVVLARATVTIAGGIPSVGAYTAVTGGTSAGAHYTWIDKPAIRDSYNYKLTVTKGGISKDIVVYKDNGSYKSSLENYISVSTQAAPANVYSIRISLSGSLAYTDDLKADIYQAESNSNGAPVNPTGWEKITTAPQTYETLSSDGFIKSGLTVGAYYVYRVVLTSTENTGKTFNVTSQSTAVQPSVVLNPSSFTWNATTTADSSVIYTSQGAETGDSDTLKLLLGAKVFVVEYDSATYEYKKVASGLSASISKAGSAAVGSVPAYKYYTSFTTTQLNALNAGASKTYYLATENVSGGFISSFKTFSVANSVTTW
jgi:hypothetical protein